MLSGDETEVFASTVKTASENENVLLGGAQALSSVSNSNNQVVCSYYIFIYKIYT